MGVPALAERRGAVRATDGRTLPASVRHRLLRGASRRPARAAARRLAGRPAAARSPLHRVAPARRRRRTHAAKPRWRHRDGLGRCGDRRRRHPLDGAASRGATAGGTLLRAVRVSLPGGRRARPRDGAAPGADPVARAGPPLRALPDQRRAAGQRGGHRAGRRLARRIVECRWRARRPARRVQRLGRARATTDRLGQQHQTLGAVRPQPARALDEGPHRVAR